MKKDNTGKPQIPEFEITRKFDVPREILWQAWTNPVKMQQWWGPREFTASVCFMDFHVGGKYLVCMRNADNEDFWSTGIFREIDRPGKLVMTDSFADAQGNIVSASHYGMPGKWPMEMLVKLTLEESGSGTKLILRHIGIPVEVSEATQTGWNESFDKLAALLAK